jgi:transcription initiation factor TFIID subunit 4
LSQGSNHTSSQSLPQWQNVSQDQSSESQVEQDQKSAQQQEQPLSGMELKQHGSVIESQQQNAVPEELKHLQMPQKKSQDDCQQVKGHPTSLQNPQTTEMQISEKIRTPIDEPDRRPSLEGESQYAKLQKISNQQATITEQASNPINRTKPGQVPFGVLLPVLQAQLDKDRAMQLQTIFAKLKVGP